MVIFIMIPMEYSLIDNREKEICQELVWPFSSSLESTPETIIDLSKRGHLC